MLSGRDDIRVLEYEVDDWRDDLDKKLQVVRDLAAELADALVPLDGIFNTAACRREKSFWTPDGVHPTPAGHALIAERWISSVSF